MAKKTKRDLVLDTVKGVKMHDAGEKPNKKRLSTPKVVEDGPYYPSLYLNAKQAPELAGHEVEDEVTLVLKCKITGHNLNESPGRSSENFDLKIKKVGVIGK